MPTIEDNYVNLRNRKDAVVYSRLRIGHTRLTHGCLMEGQPWPDCGHCSGGHQLTVQHILIDCLYFQNIRRKYYHVSDIKELFDTVSPKQILDFVKDIGLYNKF